ncbi:ABC transporter permease [Terracidiphilus gabretensis]|uniref:ABC transporter permease n=1 Tax=Terracidiphilus gabretensis TaxID=1577687 RepID=UPI00071B9260|nr:ABC transporter permease [Terracidiphilus gabretensis]
MMQDLRYAMRQLRNAPGFALTAILTLALGIGATTAIFSIVEGVLLRPLPFPDAKRLVIFGDKLEGADLGTPTVPAPEALQYMRDTHSFDALGVHRSAMYELSGAGEPAQINVTRMTASMFPALSVNPAMGRVFTKQEDEGKSQVAVLSYATWMSRFHGDPRAIGEAIELDRKPYEIIGVMPREFEFPLVPGQLNRTEMWVPMSFTAGDLKNDSSWNFQMVGRLKAGVSAEQARQDSERVTQAIMRGWPAQYSSIRIDAKVEPLDEDTVAAARPLIRTMFLAVAVVLFIACANLAGLLLVRVIRRSREFAVRLALGASGATIVRQNLMEALTLSVIGGLLGLALAAVALKAGISLLPETLPRINAIGLDWQVVGFALLLAVATGFICGLAPALAAAKTGVNDALKEGGRTGTSGARHARLRSALVITEVAVALVLLVGAGLLLRSFEKLRQVDPGFRADHVLTAYYSLPSQQYSTQASIDGFTTAVLDKVRQLPGVEAAGITGDLPASGSVNNAGFVPAGYVPPKGGSGLITAWSTNLIGDYFQAAGIPVLRGRAFTEADTADAPMVVIVNRTFAQQYWPGQDPIGKRIHRGTTQTPLPWMTVVGEIGDVKQTSMDAPVVPQFYQPVAQFVKSIGQFAPPGTTVGDGGAIVLRTSLRPETMKSTLIGAIHTIDPQLPLMQIQTMDQVVEGSQAPRKFNTAIIASFAGAAVLLALLGIYSVIAFSAAMRTQEMAIRLALGSQRSNIVRLVLLSGTKLAAAGCGIGVVASLFATQLLKSLLFEVNPLDPAVIVLAAVGIFVLALAASLVPARRAAAIEPMRALRME